MSDARNTQHTPDGSRLPSNVTGWSKHDETMLYQDGDSILVAVPIVCKHSKDGWYYRFEVLTISCDEHYLEVQDSNGDPWGYDFGDWDFYVKL
jgi:hypothetical protein